MSEKFVRYINAKSTSGTLWPEERATWGDARMALLNARRTFPNTYRVTVEEVNPLSEAVEDTEKRWWRCEWEGNHLMASDGWVTDSYVGISWRDGEVSDVTMYLESTTAPTLAEFRAAVKEATGVEIPEPEQPRWWSWLRLGGEWVDDQMNSSPYASDTYITVYGTKSTRDAKRDALLAAARAAGKDGEG